MPDSSSWRAKLTAPLLILAALVGFWMWVGAPLSVILQRGAIEGLEDEPFYPPADPRADAILASARSVLSQLAAGQPRPSPQDLRARWPGLADLGDGPWLLTLYVPTAEDHRGPHLQRVEGGRIAEAVQSLYEALPAAARTEGSIAAMRLKLDLLLPGRRALPMDGGYQGVAVDPGLDGIELSDAEGAFLFLPSWSVERKYKRRRIVRRAQQAAVSGGWTKKRSRAAKPSAFRTRAWIESVDGEGPARPTARANVPLESMDAAAVRQAIRIGGDYLVRETDHRGKITYRYRPESDTTGGGYNILRHAGTTYSMFQVFRLTGDEKVFDAASRAMRYYRARMKEDAAHPGEWFILDGGGKRQRAKLGGAGLGLLALVEMEKARPGSSDYEAMFGLARHILRQQHPDGSFESFYNWDGEERTTRKSIFYPGEALLGLTRLHQLTGDERWLDAAERGADYLVNHRWVALGLRINVPLDAWLIQALEELDRVRPDERRADYAFAIAAVIARHKLMDPAVTPPDFVGGDIGGLSSLPMSSNAGSFGEALSAGARLEARRRPGATTCRTWAERNMGMQLRNQFTEANSWFLADPVRAHGGFHNRPNDHEIGNDVVQHNISGLFGLLQLMDPSTPDIGLVVGPAERSEGLRRAMAQ